MKCRTQNILKNLVMHLEPKFSKKNVRHYEQYQIPVVNNRFSIMLYLQHLETEIKLN